MQEFTARSVFVLKDTYIDTFRDEWQELVGMHIIYIYLFFYAFAHGHTRELTAEPGVHECVLHTDTHSCTTTLNTIRETIRLTISLCSS